MSHFHSETHRAHRIGWLRAAVMGANDGIVSTASLLTGVAASGATSGNILVAGVAGLVAGALSMAAGEYVSVSSQSDTERSDLDRERSELHTQPEFELEELTKIYEQRGLNRRLAEEVAVALTRHDALGAHARDELGITEIHTARPMQAALASAATFILGAVLPLIVAVFSSRGYAVILIPAFSVVSLALLGGIAARAGGAPLIPGTLRVTCWGAAAMAMTALVGKLFGAVV